jgi:hypothetical protein
MFLAIWRLAVNVNQVSKPIKAAAESSVIDRGLTDAASITMPLTLAAQKATCKDATLFGELIELYISSSRFHSTFVSDRIFRTNDPVGFDAGLVEKDGCFMSGGN